MLRSKVYLLYGRREWKRAGYVEDYAPVVLFHGERIAQLSTGDTDGDGLLEIAMVAPEAGVSPNTYAGVAWVVKPYLPLQIDFRPNGTPNLLVIPGHSAIRVFSGSQNGTDPIDPATLRAAGASPEGYRWEDYNEDGISDLHTVFDNSRMHLPADPKQIVLTARTRGGVLVAGSDSVIVARP